MKRIDDKSNPNMGQHSIMVEINAIFLIFFVGTAINIWFML